MPRTSPPDTLRQHFHSAGFRFGLTPAKLNKELLRVMGKARFDAYMAAADAVHEAGEPQRTLYEQPQTYAEANLLMSFQADAAAEAAEAAYLAVAAGLRAGDSVVELGCWTGVLAAYIARRHPDVSVHGVDALPGVVEMAAAAHQQANLRFGVWDYTAAPPAAVPRSSVLLTVFGIDFLPLEVYGQRVAWPLDVLQTRESASYRRRLAEARPYFASWRAAATDGARLVAVLRIPSVYRALPVLDAAAEAGWGWRQDDSKHVRAGNERFPLLAFHAGDAAPAAVDDVLAWWAADDLRGALRPLSGAAAWVLYRALEPKTVVERSEHRYDEGNTSVTEVGIAGGLSYRFYSATVGDAHFTVGARSELDALRALDM